MKGPLHFLACFILIITIAASASAEETGKQLVLETCVQCHDFKWIDGQKKSEAAWRQTVNTMIWRGAPLKPGEAEIIAKYLATAEWSGGRPRPAQNEEAAKLPKGPGRELVASQCVQCHDLATTTTQRKTLAEWRHSVDEMVRLGAKLDGSEIQTIARYLAQAFGPAK